MKQDCIEEKKSTSFGIASLALGVSSLLLMFAPYIGLPLAITALVFHYKQKKINPTGMSTAGHVTGIIGIVVNSVMLIFLIGVLMVGYALKSV